MTSQVKRDYGDQYFTRIAIREYYCVRTITKCVCGCEHKSPIGPMRVRLEDGSSLSISNVQKLYKDHFGEEDWYDNMPEAPCVILCVEGPPSVWCEDCLPETIGIQHDNPYLPRKKEVVSGPIESPNAHLNKTTVKRTSKKIKREDEAIRKRRTLRRQGSIDHLL